MSKINRSSRVTLDRLSLSQKFDGYILFNIHLHYDSGLLYVPYYYLSLSSEFHATISCLVF